jgi:hypothetical protein
MAGDVDNPRIWINADVYHAPEGSTMPTTPAAALDPAFEALGLLSDDGMTESREEEQTDHYAWGGILVRTTRAKHKRTFTVTALEDNGRVFSVVNPGSTVTIAGANVTRGHYVPTEPNVRAWVIETVDGDITRRLCVARGEVTSVGDVVSSDSEMTGYELTITVYPDANGLLYTELTDDPQNITES